MSILNNRVFAVLVLVILSSTSLVQCKEDDLSNCQNEVKSIGGALGTLLVIETIFCCYVIFCWVRNLRINLKRKERNSNDPEQDENGYPMYTDADEVATQDQPQKRPKNGHPIGLSSQSSVARRHQHVSRVQAATDKIPGKKFIEGLMARRHNKPDRRMVQDVETTMSPSNEQAVEEDVGGLVYSEPYEDKVTAATELMSRKPASFRVKINKEPPPPKEETTQLVYYHVLEESIECDGNLPSTPTKPHPFAPKEGTREDVYYYCDSNSIENNSANFDRTPSTPLPFVPSNEPEDDVYYSCVPEESTGNPIQTNPKKSLLPVLPQLKPSSKATSSGLPAAQQKGYFPTQDNQSRNQWQEPANKKPLKPLNSNPMMNAHMIQEMKNRVANKKSGNQGS